MFGYMTEIDTVEISECQDVEAEGHDLLSLLFHFLDECLFLFCADPFFIARVNIFLMSWAFEHHYFENNDLLGLDFFFLLMIHYCSTRTPCLIMTRLGTMCWSLVLSPQVEIVYMMFSYAFRIVSFVLLN